MIKGTEEKTIRDIMNLFEQEQDCYKAVRVGNFNKDNNIEYESNGDKNKTLSIREYLDKIKPDLKDSINSMTDITSSYKK